MRTLSLIVSVIAFALSPSLALAIEENLDGWRLIHTDDDVRVYRKEAEKGPIVTFRGIGIIDAPIERVVSVVVDVERAKEWTKDLREAKIIRQTGKNDYVIFSAFNAPFPVKDREFVTHIKLDIARSPNKVFKVKYQATEDPDAPLTDKRVRGELTGSLYTLQAIENNTKTHLDFEVHSDPKGSIPTFIINMVQKNWPTKTISSLRKQVARPDIRLHPKVIEAFGLPSSSEFDLSSN